MAPIAAAKVPYRLQIIVPDQVRRALKRAAAREDIPQKDLVVRVLVEWLRTQPEGVILAQEPND